MYAYKWWRKANLVPVGAALFDQPVQVGLALVRHSTKRDRGAGVSCGIGEAAALQYPRPHFREKFGVIRAAPMYLNRVVPTVLTST